MPVHCTSFVGEGTPSIIPFVPTIVTISIANNSDRFVVVNNQRWTASGSVQFVVDVYAAAVYQGWIEFTIPHYCRSISIEYTQRTWYSPGISFYGQIQIQQETYEGSGVWEGVTDVWGESESNTAVIQHNDIPLNTDYSRHIRFKVGQMGYNNIAQTFAIDNFSVTY